MSLVHFDSHFDTWDEYFGEKCTHGTPFKRASWEACVWRGWVFIRAVSARSRCAGSRAFFFVERHLPPTTAVSRCSTSVFYFWQVVATKNFLAGRRSFACLFPETRKTGVQQLADLFFCGCSSRLLLGEYGCRHRLVNVSTPTAVRGNGTTEEANVFLLPAIRYTVVAPMDRR